MLLEITQADSRPDILHVKISDTVDEQDVQVLDYHLRRYILDNHLILDFSATQSICESALNALFLFALDINKRNLRHGNNEQHEAFLLRTNQVLWQKGLEIMFGGAWWDLQDALKRTMQRVAAKSH